MKNEPVRMNGSNLPLWLRLQCESIYTGQIFQPSDYGIHSGTVLKKSRSCKANEGREKKGRYHVYEQSKLVHITGLLSPPLHTQL